MNKEYVPLYVIYHNNTTTGEFMPYQVVCDLTVFYMNKKDAEKKIKKITCYPEQYEIVEYIKH